MQIFVTEVTALPKTLTIERSLRVGYSHCIIRGLYSLLSALNGN